MAEGNVAVLIDFENVGNQDHMRALMDELSGIGRITIKRAFGDWQKEDKKNQQQLQSLGVELIHHSQTTSGKNASDIRLTAEAINLLHTSPVQIDTFVIASCDSDFFPLVTILRSYGKSVYVAGRKDTTTDALVNSCDRFIDLTDLVRNTGGGQRVVGNETGEQTDSLTNGIVSRSSPTSRESVSTSPTGIAVETRGLVIRAIQSARDNEGNVKGAKLHGTILRIDPSFNFREHGFDSFTDFLEGVSGIEVKRSYGPQDITVKIAQNR